VPREVSVRFAVQLARRAGATVLGIAGPSNDAWLNWPWRGPRSTMETICRPDYWPRQSPDTLTHYWISLVVDMSPWQLKTSGSRAEKGRYHCRFRCRESGSKSSQKAALMPQPQRWSPSWPTLVARGELEVPIAGVFAPRRRAGKRTDSSNCATPAASWCCDREWRGHR